MGVFLRGALGHFGFAKLTCRLCLDATVDPQFCLQNCGVVGPVGLEPTTKAL